MIKKLSIQVQPDRASAMKLDSIHSAFEEIAKLSLVECHQFSQGEDEGRYFNFTFGTSDLRGLWREIQSRIFRDSELGPPVATSSMVMCEGTRGWDDYLLLYHFDPEVSLDDIDVLA